LRDCLCGTILLVNDVFTFNQATNGGFLSIEPGDVGGLVMTNCSTYANTANSQGVGNGVFVSGFGAYLSITNTILWDGGVGNSEVWDSQQVTTISSSDVYGGWAGAGVNDFFADPLYTDPNNGDLLPQVGSRCDNTGTPKAALFPGTDIDGVTRSATIPDIGAYEF
jgi:hypothetical protein